MCADANFLTDGMQQQTECEPAIDRRLDHNGLTLPHNRYCLRIFPAIFSSLDLEYLPEAFPVHTQFTQRNDSLPNS
jgi:hypothetical protein